MSSRDEEQIALVTEPRFALNESGINSNEEEVEPNKPNSKTNVIETAMNIAKLCMGTGTLALPFSAGQGGLIFNIIGLALVTLWNIYSVERLTRCLDYIEQYKLSFNSYYSSCTEVDSIESNIVIDTNNGEGKDEDENNGNKPSPTTAIVDSKTKKHLSYEAIEITGDDNVNVLSEKESSLALQEPATNTFGKVSWYIFGNKGVQIIDAFSIIFMMGIITAYEDAILSFIEKTPMTTGSKSYDACIMLMLISPLTCVSNFDIIAKISTLGIFIILGLYCSIAIYGVLHNGLEGFTLVSLDDLWPADFSAFSNWFGIAVFSYGVVPFNYNIQESMEDPTKMNKATQIAGWAVFTVYIIIGDIISIIFKPSVPIFEGDVISVLPQTAFPILLRIAMTVVVMASIPLLTVPCSDLLIAKFSNIKLGFIGFGDGDASNNHYQVIGLRLTICFICAYTSIIVPNFVYIISFLGCFCGSAFGFIHPPLAHLIGLYKFYQPEGGDYKMETYLIAMIDFVVLLMGIAVTFFTSIMTYDNLIKQIS